MTCWNVAPACNSSVGRRRRRRLRLLRSVMQREMGWDDAQTQREVSEYVGTLSRMDAENWLGERRYKGVEPSSWAEIQSQVKGTRTMADYVGAIDQGTTSTRFIVFNRAGQIVSTAQKEHRANLSAAGMGRAQPGRDLGAHAGDDRRGACSRRDWRRKILPPSASPTSARPPSCGTARPDRRCTTPSCGRTPASANTLTNCRSTADRIDSAPRPGCRWRPTSAG